MGLSRRQWIDSTIVLCFGFLMFGCTRPDSEITKISVSIPKSMSSQKVGAQAFDVLNHVAINVTGPGLNPPVVFSWDNRDNSSAATTSTSFTIDIPQGSGRLIQVLAVYGNSTSKGQMQFYYGDIVKDLTTTEASVPITVSSVGQGAPIISGRISGRYMTADVAGLTSAVDMLFNPPAGKPPMIVGQGAMIAGWFQFFALGGAQLSYRLRDGSFLFGGPIDLNAPALQPSASVLRIEVPTHQENEWNNGTQAWVLEDPSITVIGYFGNAADTAGKVVCKNPAGSVTKFKKSDGSAALVPVALAQPADLFAPLQGNIYMQGAIDIGGAAPCGSVIAATSAVNLYKNDLFFAPPMLDNGNDGAAGIRPPFTVSAMGGMVSSTRIDAGNVTVNGELLPGVPAVVEKFVAFKKSGVKDSNSDIAPCNNMAGQGFSPVAEGAVSLGVTAWTINLPFTTTEQSGGVLFALCPIYRGGIPGEAGFWLRGDNLNSGGGGGGTPATQLAIKEMPTSPSYLFCTRFFVQPVDASNNPGQVMSPFVVSFSGTNSAAIYTDPGCTMSAGASPQVDPSGTYFFMKSPATGAATLQVSYTSGLASALSSSPIANFTVGTMGTINSMSILTDNRYSRRALECIPFYLGAKDAAGNDTNFGNTIVNITTFTGANFSVYDDKNCATALPSMSMSAFNSIVNGYKAFYVRAPGAGTSSVSVLEGAVGPCSGSTVACAANSGAYNISSNPDGAAANLQLNFTTTTVAPATCTLVTAELRDSNFWPTAAAAGQTITVGITSNGGANCLNTSFIAITDADCSSNPTTTKPITIAPGENRVVFGVRNVAAGSGACSIGATLSSPALTAMPTMNVSF